MLYPEKISNPEFKSAIGYNNQSKRLEIGFKYAMHYNPRIKALDVQNRRQSSFLLILKGEYKYITKNFSFTARDGDMIFLPYNSKYKYEILSEETESMQIEFSVYIPKSTSQVSLCKNPFVINNCDHFKGCFSEVINCQNDTSYSGSFSLMANIYTLLSSAAEYFDKIEFDNYYGKITPAVTYIENNFNSKIYVSNLAKMCNLSESQLRRLFTDILKMSPIEYKNSLRINCAIKMLDDGYVNISEIAESLGFDNVYAFSQFFKKETGSSPSKYNK
ncbi:MAG: helix-turn-helix transcriptional regulator [Ruminococcaceae bacterium]|nr:helix-turn-helix transcriptional regulator [Oscillospiraceae bacterium]